MIPDQVIDKTFRRPGTFFERAAVHVELSEPFCLVLRRTIVDVATEGQETGTRPTREAATCAWRDPPSPPGRKA